MSRVCSEILNFIQIINENGDVIACPWREWNKIGNLFENDIRDILNGHEASEARQKLINDDYSQCPVEQCPYLANSTIEDHKVECPTTIDWPESLFLAFEGSCNYNCTCCNSPLHRYIGKYDNLSEKYSQLEKIISSILPHVKHIGANGRGELFASPHTLRLLSEWEPLANKDECSVSLETNGSMFDEKHWNQISNLGQYDLSVSITIMSFDEQTYQFLSGTKLPISRLLSSLSFVKKLREQGIINHLELATVMQEANFREMPTFLKRCINDFGADTVRIRSIFPGGVFDRTTQWFMDVRNAYHPYHGLYKQMISDPIFHDPRVLLWSGDEDSRTGEPEYIRYNRQIKLDNKMMSDDFPNDFLSYLRDSNVSGNIWIYGLGARGKILVNQLKDTGIVLGIIDKNYSLVEYNGLKVLRPDDIKDISDPIVVTVYGQYKVISDNLEEIGNRSRTLNLYDFIEWQKQ